MAEEPERKVEAKITERTKVEEEMKRWEREQLKVEKLNKTLMTFEFSKSDPFATANIELKKKAIKFELIPEENNP